MSFTKSNLKPSFIDWPVNENFGMLMYALVTTKHRSKTWGYNLEEIDIYKCKADAITASKMSDKSQHLALVIEVFDKGCFVVQCWLNNVGDRVLPSTGASERRLTEITPSNRHIYTITSNNPLDLFVYVGVTLNPATRWSNHKSKVRKKTANYEWYKWMSDCKSNGHRLVFNVVDIVFCTHYEAQSLELIWRNILRLKGLMPYLRVDRNNQIIENLFKNMALPPCVQSRFFAYDSTQKSGIVW